jgi:hypothetical protein
MAWFETLYEFVMALRAKGAALVDPIKLRIRMRRRAAAATAAARGRRARCG